MSQRVPSKRELRAQIEAKIGEARRTLEEASAAIKLHAERRAEYERLLAALDTLQRRVRETLAEAEQTPPTGPGQRSAKKTRGL